MDTQSKNASNISWRSSRRAFTLVELLVVIGIIALLISILLPALGEARKQAAKTKCAAALRQIGYAFQMYSIDSKGWYPPSQLAPGGTAIYDVNGTDYPNSGYGAYWYNFLEKYVTKTKIGLEAQNGGETLDARTRSIIWGCPAWEGYQSTSVAGGGYNRLQTGYGMTKWPTYTPGFPAAGTNYPQIPSLSANTNFIQNWGIAGTTGQFFKEVVYGHMGSQRCLVADSRFWAVDSEQVPSTGIDEQPNIQNTVDYTNYNGGQTYIDTYRHGTYPGLSKTNALNFSKFGGKPAFNILYCDGHVETSALQSEAFHAVRQRYPG